MSEIWVSSDHHVGHKNVLKYCPLSRPFASVATMDEAIIARHNELVSPDDEVYFIGDFSFSSVERTCEILSNMHGIKHYIYGSHCKVMRHESISKYFKWLKKYEEIIVDGKRIILFHNPIREWEKKHYNSFHFYGHMHSHEEGLYYKDIGVDSNNLYPYNIRDLLERLTP